MLYIRYQQARFKSSDGILTVFRLRFLYIGEMLDVFHIKHSLSMKGCPYDNAVAEANIKAFKTKFVRGRNFNSLEQLRAELTDYVHWFNHLRLHDTLNYMSPVEYRLQTL